MAFAPGQLEAIDPARIDKDVATEVLSNAQELLKSQLDSVDSLDGKLTTLLSQTATLATAALGARRVGVLGQHGRKVDTAEPRGRSGRRRHRLAARRGLGARLPCGRGNGPRRFSDHSKLANPAILNASSPAMSYMAIALQLEAAIERNDTALLALARKVYVVQWSLVAGVNGIVAALFIRG